jgi:type I restriction enzyme S subunit
MIDGLKPYPAYNDSGVPWLGQVPEHWAVRKLKHLTRFHNGLAFKPNDWSSSGTPIIRIQNLNGSNYFNYTTKTDLPEFLLIRKGDLLFSWSGNRGTSFGPFIWTRDFEGYLNQHIFKLDGYTLYRSYFAHLLRAVTAHIEEQTHGIIGLVHITKPELGAVLVPVAPKDEQHDIALFLDHADRRIRRYIHAKQKLIKLLEEQKQVIIQRAVTRGLDPNVPLKPSGVEWLGEVPEHWDVKPAKYFYREVDERSTTGQEELLSVSHITGVTPPRRRTRRGEKISD